MFSILILILVVIGVGVTSAILIKRKQAVDDTKQFFLFRSLSEKLLLLTKRFPISILLIVGLATLFFVAINNTFEDIPYRLWIFFSVGIFICTSTTLFTEDFFSKLRTYGISLFAVLLWGVYCFFLPKEIENLQTSKWIEFFVIGATAFLAMFFISFLRKNTDRAFWNFATQTLSQMVTACVFGAILFGGLSLALLAIHSLFNVSFTEKIYENLAVICFVLFSLNYFLANIPGKAEKSNNKILHINFQKILALYIITPILAIYTLILYVYLFKIIIAWELPNGWVSWLVSALALGGLLVISLVYPIREHGDNKVANFISRWFGLLILPLLVLMSIGIFRRIGDYGITINRAYILLLNLWFYGIYIYLSLSRSRHVKWILISPVVIALLSSISVWSMANLTKHSLTKEISAILNQQMSSEEAKDVLSTMTQPEKERMKSALEYLHENFGKESVQPFFKDTVSDSYWKFLSELELRHLFDEKHEYFSYYAENNKTWQIEDYSTFTEVSYYNYTKNDNNNPSPKKQITIDIEIENRRFVIPIEGVALEYITTAENLRNEKDWLVRGEDYALLINSFNGCYYPQKDSIIINLVNGYLFYK